MDVEGMVCLIAGGGKVASRKVFTMLEYGAAMRVIAPEAEEEIAALAEMGRISYEARACAPEDVDGADFVIAATSDEGLNRAISRRCKSLRIPVNVVDVQEECSFIFPALVARPKSDRTLFRFNLLHLLFHLFIYFIWNRLFKRALQALILYCF